MALVTYEEILEEMLEFGLRLEVAELAAPHFLRLENDPRGFRRAFMEDEPWLAELCGAIRRH